MGSKFQLQHSRYTIHHLPDHHLCFPDSGLQNHQQVLPLHCQIFVYETNMQNVAHLMMVKRERIEDIGVNEALHIECGLSCKLCGILCSDNIDLLRCDIANHPGMVSQGQRRCH